jgi:integrase
MKALVYLLHRTGARIAEVLALNLSDLNPTQRKFQVIGKGNKIRWCFYSEDAATVLEKYLKYYRHPESDALFTAQKPITKLVTRLSYRTAHRDWTNLIESAPELDGSWESWLKFYRHQQEKPIQLAWANESNLCWKLMAEQQPCWSSVRRLPLTIATIIYP